MQRHFLKRIALIFALFLCLVPNSSAASDSGPQDEFYYIPAYKKQENMFSVQTGKYYKPWAGSKYILAWEDLAEESSGLDKSLNSISGMVNSVIPNPIPEPSTVFLFGAGLAVLAVIAGSRGKKKCRII